MYGSVNHKACVCAPLDPPPPRQAVAPGRGGRQLAALVVQREGAPPSCTPPPRPCTPLMAPHHTSSYSTPPHPPRSCRWEACGCRGRAAQRGRPVSCRGCPRSGHAPAACSGAREGEASGSAPVMSEQACGRVGVRGTAQGFGGGKQGRQVPPPPPCPPHWPAGQDSQVPHTPPTSHRHHYRRHHRLYQHSRQLVLGARQLAHDLGAGLPQLAIGHLQAGEQGRRW